MLHASVTKALEEQRVLIEDDEKIGLDPAAMSSLGIAAGMQVRVTTADTGAIAVYTAVAIPSGIRMGASGRKKLEPATTPFHASLDASVARSGLSDAVLRDTGDFGERLFLGGDFLLALAPHGGDNEAGTSEMAIRLAEVLAARGASYWMTRGYSRKGSQVNAHERWHITSADMHQRSFPFMAMALWHSYTHAVAFHGHAESFVLVGGRADAARRQKVADVVKKVLPGVTVTLAGSATTNGGNVPSNPLNLATDKGAGSVQLELPRDVRLTRGKEIAEAIGDLYLKGTP